MKTLVMAAGLVGLTVSGLSGATDGNDLQRNCKAAIQGMSSNEAPPLAMIMGMGQCLGLIEGVRNSMLILNDNLPKNYQLCVPKEGVTNMQALVIVDKFLHDNPAMLNLDQTGLVMLAYKKAYPCK
jgi:hypothetical protein